jgi:hypothetical protein
MLRHSLTAPPARSYEDRIVIRPMGDCWEDVNWEGEGHRTCVIQELGTLCRLLYLGIFTIASK